MNVFIETPHQAAARAERARCGEDGLRPDAERPAGARDRGSALFNPPFAERGREGAEAVSEPPGQTASEPADGASPRKAGAFPSGSSSSSEPAAQADLCQSVAEESYEAEKAFDRRRARGRKRAAVLRVLAVCVLLPVALAGVFLVSYALTCILNGASPEELGVLMAELFERAALVAQHVAAELGAA